MNGRPPFPFVVGCGRSGTTLLRAVLDAHPELAVPGESHFLAGMGDDRARYEREDGFDADRFTDDLAESERFLLWGLPVPEVREELASHDSLDFPEAVRAVYALYARRQGKRRYGDKTPNHVLRIPLFAGLFPEARFIHLIRDGRDVALSLLDLAEWGPTDVETAAERWKQFVATGRAGARETGAERYTELRYEDLLSRPEASLRRLCEFLELPFDDGMLRHHEGAESLLETVSLPHNHAKLRLPLTQGLRDWRTQMADEDRRAFESVAGDLLDELGYEREVS